MSNSFQGKVVWITGASSGIGEALAYQFVKEGARIILSSRNEKELNRVKENCKDTSTDIYVLPLDLGRPEDISEKAIAAITRWNRIDYMVHNAGIAARDLAENTSMEVIRKVMETNFFGTVGLTKAILPYMQKEGEGHLVVILSLSAKFGAPLLSAYAASKHALVGYFESLRAEIGKSSLRVHMIVPGFINTPILVNAIDGAGAVRGKNLAVNEKGMSADECAVRIIKALKKGKLDTSIGIAAAFSVWMSRMFPSFFRNVISSHPIKRLRKLFPRLFK